MARNRRDTFFTNKQIEILKLRALGLSTDEIAQRLGVTKSDVHTIMRSIERTVAKAKNTLKLYAELVGGLRIIIDSGTPIESAMLRVLNEADIHNIKVSITGIEFALKMVKDLGNDCIDLEKGIILCPIEIVVKPNGTTIIRKLI